MKKAGTPFICLALILALSEHDAHAATSVSITGISQAGIFDPSIADTPVGQRAWMNYSAVDPSPLWPAQTPRTETTRLAYSDNGGASWTDLGMRVNDIQETRNGSSPGLTWVNEVSSLVYDPYAPATERWKLFWHRYAESGEDRRFEHGWLAYKCADRPEDLRAAPEIKLFGGKGYKEVNNDPRGETGSPVAGPPVIDITKLAPDLENCVALSEPGAIATSAGLYLAMTCPQFHLLPLPHITSKIVMLQCAAPCRPTDAGAWKYLGTPLSDDDNDTFDVTGLSQSDLFVKNGQIYLMVSPGSDEPVEGAMNGCLVFHFQNIETATLEQSQEKPRVIVKILGTPGSFNGACTYAPAAAASGFVYSEIKMTGGRPFFQVFQTGKGF